MAKAGIGRSDLIISTVPDIEDNLLLLQGIRNKKKKVVVIAQDVEEVKTLYKAGAYYVVLPYLVEGFIWRELLKMII